MNEDPPDLSHGSGVNELDPIDTSRESSDGVAALFYSLLESAKLSSVEVIFRQPPVMERS